MTKWKKCSEEMPPAEIDVLCWRGYGMPPIVAGIFHSVWADEETGREPRGNISHWMPLPPSPSNAEITGRTLAQNEADGA